MEIVVLDGHTVNPGDNPWDPLARLGRLTVYDRTPSDRVSERARTADIILTNKVHLDAQTLAELPRLQFISVLATGYNIVDVTAARHRGIAVSNVPEYGTASVAQHTIALLLELCNQVGLHSNAVAAGEWTRNPDFCFWRMPPIELAGLLMGIVGFGRIGQQVGALARAFGMNVTAAAATAGARGAVTRTAVRDLFAEADVVTLHCPLTSENARFVKRDLLGCMKPTAFLINTARGGLVDEQDLADALNNGRLAGAAVDVVAVEPLRADNPLRGARNCIITPHMAWGSLAARRRLMQITLRNVQGFLVGRPINVVN